MKENSIFITDEDGKEVEMKILMTFEANQKKYVVVYDEKNEDELYPFVYDDEGNLFAVEDEEEMAMIDEVVSAYEEEEKE
ncbi:MAG: DUF1292 domain-containing protein [Erysipelotrichaceae bacterium]|jgi:uncharacterized protein YrzB (UPF0473 family)|nr:DUF1292 domain-containing protein [Erysipelotrichaceae bacterium]MBQ1774773.1 DUF1292 domain-containing protein [Erysipelotrichaceae bacterium]MBQ1811404.1 DUF1292 domain-containing protein [Erysipelotrichaceae bacterium]MBQ1911638.1 DUF1292 domain-containing protein [Erysipelotrichaceae bacterium]MBQ2079234.1 DUF1292 domain-containing protein [Erysipelotrichaceae bacterium]